MHRLWSSLLLLASWLSLCSALVVTYPAANMKLPLSYPFQLSWNLTGGTPLGYISVYLSTSKSVSTAVAVVSSGLSDNSGINYITVRPPVQPGYYYLYLNDSNPLEGNAYGGPYYFTNSITTPESGPGPSFPLWVIPIILLMILIHAATLFYLLGRMGCLGEKWRRRFRRETDRPLVYQTQYIVYRTGPPVYPPPNQEYAPPNQRYGTPHHGYAPPPQGYDYYARPPPQYELSEYPKSPGRY